MNIYASHPVPLNIEIAERPRRARSLVSRAGGLALLALAMAVPACVAEPIESDESNGTEAMGKTEQAIAPSTTTNVPLALHFLYDHFDAATGLPAYWVGTQSETILYVDNAIAAINAKLDATRGTDSRRVQVVRVSVRYAPAPLVEPDPVSTMEPYHVHNAINVLLTSVGGGVATSAWSTRTDAGALAHEIGHTLGLHHTFDRNNVAGEVEMMYRDENSSSAASCYRLGDNVCDTPPDYGYLRANGSTEWIACSTLISGQNLCVQNGPPCRIDDFVIDQRVRSNGQKVCVPISGGLVGRRTYDAGALGLIEGQPSNILAYHSQDFFTYGQFLRMHGFAQWRMRVPERVPAAEQAKLLRMAFGPADPVWTQTTNRDFALANAQTQTLSWSYASAPTSGSGLTAAAALAIDEARRVFSTRVRATIAGTPSSAMQVTVTPPGGSAIVVPRSAIRVAGAQLTVDESTGLASPLASVRGRRNQGPWTVNVRDTGATVTVSSLALDVVSADRGQVSNDRDARGIGDVLAFRPSTGQLWISSNMMNGLPQFWGGMYDQPAPAPYPSSVIGGDIDGDGTTDLLSRSGSSIFVAFGSEWYATWHPKSITGGDLPLGTDEVLLGDFDGDGFADLMRRRKNTVIDRGVWKYHRGRGDGTFEAGLDPSIGGSGTAYVANAGWTVGDFNVDGRADILVRYKGSGLFWLSRNITALPGQTPTFYGGMNPTIGGSYYAYLDTDRLLAMDVNGDGRDDIVIRRQGAGQWWTSTNVNDVTYNAGVNPTIGGSPYAYLDTDIILGALP